MISIISTLTILFFSQLCYSQSRPRTATTPSNNTSSSRSIGSNWKFGLGLGYSPVYLVNLSGSGSLTGAPYSVSYDFQYQYSTSIQLDYWNLSRNNFGFISGFQYEPQRTIYTGKLNGINVNVANVTFAKFQTNFLYIGAAYRWNIFYIPVGLTYGMHTVAPASNIGTTTTENGFGYMLGLGWFVKDNFVIEYSARTAAIKMSYVNGTDFENVSGTVAASVLSFKYFF